MGDYEHEDWRPWVFYNGRPTTEESARRRRHLLAIGRAIQPTNVRGFMYAVVVRGLLDKEIAYAPVQNLLNEMREAGEMPWELVIDETRPVFIPQHVGRCRRDRGSVRGPVPPRPVGGPVREGGGAG
jgi:hypothetical protein